MSCYGATIVIVDDSAAARIHIRTLAERLGMKVIAEGSSPEDALELFVTLQPDVMVLDAAVPELAVFTTTPIVLKPATTALLAYALQAACAEVARQALVAALGQQRVA